MYLARSFPFINPASLHIPSNLPLINTSSTNIQLLYQTTIASHFHDRTRRKYGGKRHPPSRHSRPELNVNSESDSDNKQMPPSPPREPFCGAGSFERERGRFCEAGGFERENQNTL